MKTGTSRKSVAHKLYFYCLTILSFFYVSASAQPTTINLEEVKNGGNANSLSVSTAAALTAVDNHLYIAIISSKSKKDVLSVNGLGLTWTERIDQCAGRNQTGIEIWTAQGIPSGNEVVTALFDNTPSNAVIAVARYSGVDPLNAIGNFTSFNTNGEAASCSGGSDGRNYAYNISTTIANSLIFSAAAHRNRNHTAGSGYTAQGTFDQGSGGSAAALSFMDKSIALPSTETVDGTFSGSVDWATGTLVIQGGSGVPQYTLSSLAAPSIGGSVSRAPDKSFYDENESVDLTATPATGFLFDGWSGDIGGATASNPVITLTMDQNRTVTANFTPIQRTLSTTVTPGGSGSISLSPDKATYDHGETVSLTANPGSTYEFTGWSGDIGGANPTSNPLIVTMDQDRNVSANFQPKPEYVSATVTPSDDTPLTGNNITAIIALDMSDANGATLGSLSSTLQWDPAVLSYSGNGGLLNSISGSVDESNTGSGQLAIDGTHPSGIGGVINIIEIDFTVIGAANDASALDLSFSSLASFTATNWLPTLTITDSSITVSGRSLNTAAAPVDGGNVTRSPDKGFYDNGENVTLNASPASGYLFVNWSGDIGGANASSPTIDVAMSQDRNITANFAPIQRTLSSNVSPVGTGSISASPNKATYDHGESVSVTANAGTGFQFSHWSGDIGGANASATTISLTMDQDRSITANFIDGPTEITYEGTTTGGSSEQLFVETSTAVDAYNGQLYLVAVSSKPYEVVNSVSGMGLTWERVDLQCSGREHNMVDIWMAIGNPSGNDIVRANFADDPKHAVIAVSRFSGIDATSPLGNNASANSNGLDGTCSGGSDQRDYSYSLTTTVDGAMIYNITSTRNKTHTPGSGYSEHFEFSQGSSSNIANIAFQEKKAETAGAHTVNGFFSGKVDWSSVALEILPAGSSGPPRYALTTAVNPSIGGSVSKTPNLSNYEENSLVELSATPSANYEFANWSGDIGGANPTDLVINVTMSQSRAITANFTPVQRFLSSSVSPTGSGSVAATPAKSSYDHGESVSLTATAADNFEFVNWSGDIGSANPTVNPLALTMDQDRNVSANFQPLPEYVYARVVPDNDSALTETTVTAQINIDMSSTNSELGNFSGSLSWDETVLSYNANGGLLNNFSGTVDVAGVAGGDINFTASHPAGIAGDVAILQVTFDVIGAAGSASPLDLAFSALQSRATLDLLPTLTVTDSSVTVIGYQLTAAATPENGGFVQASPDKAVYNNGEVVTLSATAAEHHLFNHWQGDIGDEDPAATSINITMDSNKNIEAIFNAVQRTLTIGTNPGGAGAVTRSPEKATYDHGEVVTLTANPGSGFQFANWSGDIGSADPNSSTINLTMDQDRSVTAGFSVGNAEVVYEGSTTGSSSDAFFVETSTSVTAVANDLYLAVISSKPYKPINNVSGMGLTWEIVDVQCSGRSHNMVEIWRAMGTPSGDGIVRADFADDPNHAVIAVSRYSGVDDVTPVGAVVPVNSNGIDGACSSGSDGRDYSFELTTNADGSVIYSIASIRNKTHTPGSDYSELFELSRGSGSDIVNIAIQTKTVETAGTETVDGVFNGKVDWSAIALEIMPAGSSGPRQFSLATTVDPAGSGSINRSVNKPTYDEGEQVTLTAVANTGWRFLSWSGDIGTANPSLNTLDILMTQDRLITANFEELPGLISTVAPSTEAPFPGTSFVATIAVDMTPINDLLGSFSASLSWDPAVLTYVSNGGLLQGFTGNIDLTNVASGQLSFSGNNPGGVGNVFNLLQITLAATGGANTSSTLDLAYNALANAADASLLNEAIIRDSSVIISGHLLTTTVNDPARGSISANPVKATYDPNEAVELSATANFGYAFSEWSGDIGSATPGDNPISVTMNQDRSINASFTPLPRTLSVAVSPLDSGTVSSNPNQTVFDHSETVELTAISTSGLVFTQWSGDVPASDIRKNPLTLTMDQDRSVSAVFAAPSGYISFAAIGDFGDGSDDNWDVSGLIKQLGVDIVLTVGDNVYGSDYDRRVGQFYHEYIGNYPGIYGQGSDVNRFFPAVGNHDWDEEDLNDYLDFFDLPGPGVTSTNTSGNERYYDVIQGPVHFFFLDSDPEEPDGVTYDSTQGRWLQAQLAASTTPWQIVLMHHAAYSSGSYHGNHDWMQWPFEEWGVDAVFAGHDHHYERIIKDDNNDNVDIPHFVTGIGGNNTRGYSTPYETGSEMRYNDDFGTMYVVANNAGITFQFYSITNGGTLIDQYTIGSPIGIYPLTTSAAPSGGGTIVADTAKLVYYDNESVTLTANPSTGYTFSHWSGDIGNVNASDNPITVEISDTTNIIANFDIIGGSSTPVNFTVAFFGDQGINNNAVAVMNMIKDEGADMIMHAGDLDYVGEPDEWVAQIAEVFPDDFPYFAAFGDKEAGHLTGSGSYQEYCEARMNLIGIPWDGSLGIQSSFTFNGIFFITTAPGVAGSNHPTYIRNQLAANNDIWRVNIWHKNMTALSPGLIGSGIGWDIYRESRQAGVFIITGDDHIYGRTHLLSSMENQVMASTSDTLVLVKDDPATIEDEGRSFVAVSGLGGRGINAQRNFDPLWASVYSRNQDANPGALFGVFNYNGQSDLARFYFKDIDGNIVDSFYVHSTTQTPTLAKQSQNTVAPSRTFLAKERAFLNTSQGSNGAEFTAPPISPKSKGINPPGEAVNNKGGIAQNNYSQKYLWKFKVDSIPGDVARATLRLYATATDTAAPDIHLHHISNTLENGENWVGKRISQQSLPSVVLKDVSTAGSVHKARWLEFDLTKIIQSPGEYSFMIESSSSQGQLLEMENSKNEAQLIVRLADGKDQPAFSGIFNSAAAENSPGLQTLTLPDKFALLGNYPNPFNMETMIRYALPIDADVRITVYNILGQPVNTLVNGYQSAGFKTVSWNGFSTNGQPVSSGIYFVVMAVDKQRFVQKIMLQK